MNLLIPIFISAFISGFIVWLVMRQVAVKSQKQLEEENDRLRDDLTNVHSNNALEIVRRGGQLYDRFVGLYGDLEKIGEFLKNTQTSFDSAVGKLKVGRGNLMWQVEKLKSLGAKTQKILPAGDLAE